MADLRRNVYFRDLFKGIDMKNLEIPNEIQVPDEFYQKLLDYFENLGYACELSPLADSGRDVPIAGPEAWDSLVLDGREEVLVYFDESNRADYLSGRVDGERYGLATRFGLRFVLVYGGEDEGVREALENIPNE